MGESKAAAFRAKFKARDKLSFFDEKNRQQLAAMDVTSWKPAMGWFDVLMEASICGLLIATVIIYFMFASKISSQKDVFRTKTIVYDADSSAPCHFHLLDRLRTGSTTNASLYPGQPGSWSLSPNASGLSAAASMFEAGSNLDSLWTIFSVLVSIVITLMVVNLIRLVGFQPRLSVIPASLYLMMNDFFHLILVFVIISLPATVLVIILIGPVSKEMSSFSDAFVGVLTMFITGAGLEG